MVIIIVIFIIIFLFLIYGFLPSFITKKIFFYKKNDSSKVIYLTFDDGPSLYTNELLDLLKKYNIKASFFCVVEFAKKHPDIIRRLKNENHIIGLHSLKHKNYMLQSVKQTKSDFENSIKIMENLNIRIKYFRPPWGDINLSIFKLLKKYNLEFILWNVMAEDWEGNTTKDIIAQKLLDRVKPGDIICLHDGRGKNNAPQRTIEALELVLPIFIERGYIFKKIDEYGK